jgi:hypothetical protein
VGSHVELRTRKEEFKVLSSHAGFTSDFTLQTSFYLNTTYLNTTPTAARQKWN